MNIEWERSECQIFFSPYPFLNNLNERVAAMAVMYHEKEEIRTGKI